MDELDSRLRRRLQVLAEAVPVSVEPVRPVRVVSPAASSRGAGFSALATGAAVVLIATMGLVLLIGRGAPATGETPEPPVTTVPSVTDSPGSKGSPSPSVRAATGFRGLPVDPSLAAVSPDEPQVATALNACVFPVQRSMVVGMARLPAREVHRFMLTNGKEPELATDELVWAIQLQGLVPSRSGTIVDPLCVVIGGEPWHYAPYGLEGKPFSPPPDFVDPQVALPPLLPTSVPPTDLATPAPSAATTRSPADVALPARIAAPPARTAAPPTASRRGGAPTSSVWALA